MALAGPAAFEWGGLRVANKLARVVWALAAKHTEYSAQAAATA